MTSSDATPYTIAPRDDTGQVLGELTLSGEPDDEHTPVDQVVEAVRGLVLPVACLERLQQSVTEAIRNAIRHRNKPGQEEKVLVRVLVLNTEVQPIKRQPSGGWGFFLIERTEQAPSDQARRVIELFVYREGGKDERKSDRVRHAFAATQGQD